MNECKIAVMQPYLFPYVGYFQLINAVDKYVFFDDVQWIKGWINRHTILQNNSEFKVTLAVEKHAAHDMINQVMFTSNPTYQTEYLNKIVNAYRKAPNFEKIYSLIEKVVGFDDKRVSQLIAYSIRQLNEILDIKTELLFSSEVDYNHEVSAQNKIIDITKKLGGNVYVNNINGYSLYNREDFTKAGLTLKFLQKEIDVYPQFKNDFVPFLSIIDCLMFNDVEVVRKMVNKGILL